MLRNDKNVIPQSLPMKEAVWQLWFSHSARTKITQTEYSKGEVSLKLPQEDWSRAASSWGRTVLVNWFQADVRENVNTPSVPLHLPLTALCCEMDGPLGPVYGEQRTRTRTHPVSFTYMYRWMLVETPTQLHDGLTGWEHMSQTQVDGL